MKLNAGKRVLMFFHWLFSLLICAAFTVYLVKPDFITGIYEKCLSMVGGTKNMQIIGGAFLAIYLILVVCQLCLIFRRRRREDRGFITVDSSETGRVRIAISAIEQMVRQSVHSIDGIAEMKIFIDNVDDAIAIGVTASIVNGSHVPTITMNMQRAIRQFVEMNCGVAVRTVSISINSVTNSADTPRRKRRFGGEAAKPVPAPVTEFKPEPVQEPIREIKPEPVRTPEPEPAGPELRFDDPDFKVDYTPHLELTPTLHSEDEPAGEPETPVFGGYSSTDEAEDTEASSTEEEDEKPLL